jgi:hypothetical protein
MKTLFTALFVSLVTLAAAQNTHYYIHATLENAGLGTVVFVEASDGSSVILSTDENGIAFGEIVTDGFVLMTGGYNNCNGDSVALDFGGIDTMFAYGIYCTTLPEAPPPFGYELNIAPSGALSLLPDVQGVHFKVSDSTFKSVPANYKKWKQGLYYVKAMKGNDIVASFQINKTE